MASQPSAPCATIAGYSASSPNPSAYVSTVSLNSCDSRSMAFSSSYSTPHVGCRIAAASAYPPPSLPTPPPSPGVYSDGVLPMCTAAPVPASGATGYGTVVVQSPRPPPAPSPAFIGGRVALSFGSTCWAPDTASCCYYCCCYCCCCYCCCY